MSEQNIPKKRARRVGGSRVVFSLVVTLLFACVYFYIALPAINLHDPGFYFFFLLCSVIFCLLCIITGDYAKADGGAGAGLRAVWKNCKIPLILCAGLALLMIFGGLAGSVVFRSRAYTQLLTVEQGDFAQDVEEISFDQIPMLDSDSAAILGNRKLGELADMVSQFEVADEYYQINYRGTPVRVATLRYGDLFKWFSNMKNGLPAYVRINMVSQNVEIVRLAEGMRFSTGDHFSRNLTRRLRLDDPTWLFGEPNFEIDDEGRPYWI